MLETRVMPCLLLRNAALVKTIKFRDPGYVGDPINAIRIYNEKEVDELIFLDITATLEHRDPPFQIVQEIATECFMPVTFGGGVRTLEHVRKLFSLGIEKVAVNSAAFENPSFVTEVASTFGSQSIVVSIDARKTGFFTKRHEVFVRSGRKKTGKDPATYARKMQELGAGEILLTSIDRDGTQDGYDLELIRQVTRAVTIPVIACGGAGKVDDFGVAVKEGGASAVAAGSMVVYFGRNRAVLINFPTRQELENVL